MDNLIKETETKTPVEIVQELIAIHTTRKEASEKITGEEITADFKTRLADIVQQSDRFIAELMAELSNFGDAVASDVSRENDYQQTWKDALGNFEAMNPQDITSTFQQMENTLKTIYRVFLETKMELSAPLHEILNRQMETL